MVFLNFRNFFSIFLEFSITCRVGTKRNNNFYFLSFWAVLNLFFLQMKPKWYCSNFLNFFANCLEFSITHWVGTKRNETIIYIFSISWPFPTNFCLKRSHNSFFSIFLQFFCNFLLRVWLERNRMIIFSFPVSRSIPTYYGLKWSHNDIFIFSEFFYYFYGIFYTRWVGTKRNDNFCFPSFSAFSNLFWH